MTGGAALASAGCVALRTIDVPVDSEAVIPPASIVEQLLGDFVLNDFDFKQSFVNTRYTPEDVDGVYLREFRIRILSPEDQDLSFLGKVTVLVETADLPATLLAEAEPIAPGATKVEFAVTSEDLQEYLLADEYVVTVKLEDARRPNSETRIKLEASFDVIVATEAIF